MTSEAPQELNLDEPELSEEKKLILNVLTAIQNGILTDNISTLGIIAVNGKEPSGGVGVFAYPTTMNGISVLGLARLFQTSVEQLLFSENPTVQSTPDRHKLN